MYHCGTTGTFHKILRRMAYPAPLPSLLMIRFKVSLIIVIGKTWKIKQKGKSYLTVRSFNQKLLNLKTYNEKSLKNFYTIFYHKEYSRKCTILQNCKKMLIFRTDGKWGNWVGIAYSSKNDILSCCVFIILCPIILNAIMNINWKQAVH